ncbi:MAG: sugar transferase [Planctomycetaceae bacterium]|nr:sugar transferase [Planctomycetaceae bacterium]
MYDLFRRIVDVFISVIALVVLSPLLLMIALIVYFTSPGGVFYCSRRIGKNEKPFTLYKFRSMVSGADKIGALNVAHTDARVTPVGRVLRTTKLDELPQFFNVIIGDVTLIGPRADIPEYIKKVPDQKKKLILSVNPGLSDWASLFAFAQYADFAKASDPDEYHIKYIHPVKLALQEYYVRNRSLTTDIHIFILTALRMIKINPGIPAHVKKIINEAKKNID